MSIVKRFSSLSLVVVAALTVAVLLAKPASALECELQRFDGGRKFVVEAWAVPDAEFDVGEPLRLQMRVSSPSFLNLFHVSTSCKVTRLIHNLAIRPAVIIDFPLSESGIEIVVKPPAGDEAFHLVSTRTPFEFLSGADILRQTGDIAALDLNPAQYYRRLNDALGRVNPDDWSVTTLHTSVVTH